MFRSSKSQTEYGNGKVLEFGLLGLVRAPRASSTCIIMERLREDVFSLHSRLGLRLVNKLVQIGRGPSHD